MEYKIKGNLLHVKLKEGEKLYSKPNSISFIRGGKVKAYLNSIEDTLFRAISGGELVFNEIVGNDKCELILNSKEGGKVIAISLNGEGIIGDNHLSHTQGIEIKPYINPSALSMLFKVKGKGTLFLFSNGEHKHLTIKGEAFIRASSLVFASGDFELKRHILGEGFAKFFSSKDIFLKIKGNAKLIVSSPNNRR